MATIKKVNISQKIKDMYQGGKFNYSQIAEKLNLDVSDVTAIVEGTIDKNVLKNVQTVADKKEACATCKNR